MRDLMAHHPDFALNDVHLLKIGRHFRLSRASNWSWEDMRMIIRRSRPSHRMEIS